MTENPSISTTRTSIRAIVDAKLGAAADKLAKFNQLSDAEKARWQKEVDMLERRTVSEFVEVDLGNGKDKLVLYGAPSEQRMSAIGELDTLRQKIDPTAPDASEQAAELIYIILELITPNPLLTAEYFRDNKEKYATQDALVAVMAYMKLAQQRAKDIVEVQSFRTK
jgi:hypothetical protein